jgi:hypothetical protein
MCAGRSPIALPTIEQSRVGAVCKLAP